MYIFDILFKYINILYNILIFNYFEIAWYCNIIITVVTLTLCIYCNNNVIFHRYILGLNFYNFMKCKEIETFYYKLLFGR